MLTSDLPRPSVDRIDGAGPALAVFAAAARRPLEHETLALVLDAEHRGRALLQVRHTAARDRVLGVLDAVLAALRHAGDAVAVVLATVRPDGPPGASDDPADVDRWLEMSELAERAGVELLEWFVIGSGCVSCPRDRLGEPPRW